MKKSIKNLICVASMATVIAASFCTVSADTSSWNLCNYSGDTRLLQTDNFGTVNAVVGTITQCKDYAVGVDIKIYSGGNYIGMIRPRINESTKSYIQNINNCNTKTTLASNGSGRCIGYINTY